MYVYPTTVDLFHAPSCTGLSNIRFFQVGQKLLGFEIIGDSWEISGKRVCVKKNPMCSVLILPSASEIINNESYLTDREQFVTYKETQSEVMDLNYGVPQGSVLGPSLFSIHFDGVSSSINLSNCTLYADDTELHASDCTAASAAASVNCDLVNIRINGYLATIWYQIPINPWS